MRTTRCTYASFPISGRHILVWCLSTAFLLSAGCRAPRRVVRSPAVRPHHVASLRSEFPDSRTEMPRPAEHPVDSSAVDETAAVPEDPVEEGPEDWDVESLNAGADAGSEPADPVRQEDNEWVISSPEQALEWLDQSGADIGLDYDDRHVTRIDLAFLRITDEQLQLLTFFPELRELDLTGTDVSDAGLASLVALSQLESLKLRGTVVTDAGLDHLASLSHLKILDLSRTAVSDAGLTRLGELPELRYLLLNHTQVSNEGLLLLSRMSTLRGINLIGTLATQDAIADLQEQMPDCVIISATREDLSAVRPPEDYQPASNERKEVTAVEQELRTKFRELVELARQKPELAEHLASVCAGNRRWSEAVEILQSLPVERGEDIVVRRQLANALVHTDRADEALQVLCEVVGEAVAHQQVGRMIFDRALADAEAHMIHSLRIDPHNSEARRQMQLLRFQQSQQTHLVSEDVTPLFQNWVPEVKPGNHDGDHVREPLNAAAPLNSREPQLPSWKRKQAYPVGWSTAGAPLFHESDRNSAAEFRRN